MVVAAHVSDVVDFIISHDVVTVIACSNGEKLLWSLPLPVFRRSLAKAQRFLVEHDAAGQVVRMRKG